MNRGRRSASCLSASWTSRNEVLVRVIVGAVQRSISRSLSVSDGEDLLGQRYDAYLSAAASVRLTSSDMFNSLSTSTSTSPTCRIAVAMNGSDRGASSFTVTVLLVDGTLSIKLHQESVRDHIRAQIRVAVLNSVGRGGVLLVGRLGGHARRQGVFDAHGRGSVLDGEETMIQVGKCGSLDLQAGLISNSPRDRPLAHGPRESTDSRSP